MKIWIVKIGTNSKTFFNEESFNAWLSTTTDAVSNKVVEVYEANPVERRTVKEIKDSIKDANIRESRIQAVVSEDPWFSKYENFKNELSKYPITQPLIEKLNMLGSDKKIITKYGLNYNQITNEMYKLMSKKDMTNILIIKIH